MVLAITSLVRACSLSEERRCWRITSTLHPLLSTMYNYHFPLALMTHSMLTKHLQQTVTLKSGLDARGPRARVVPQRGPTYIRQSRILFHCDTSLKVLQR